LIAVLIVGAVLLALGSVKAFLSFGPRGTTEVPPDPFTRGTVALPRELVAGRHLTVWWDALPTGVRTNTRRSGDGSNVRPADYLGRPEACKQCHSTNYNSWSTHPHRWMNALADATTVKGDFSGNAFIAYKGGRATFDRQPEAYFMRLQRDGDKRTYKITQTIGSRFYQYYVGKQVEGSEPPSHHFYTKDHLLPFGYWLDEKEWVPVVHIGPETKDADRPDPFKPPESGQHYAEYAASCNYCHTTFPLGDLLGRRSKQLGDYAPLAMHWLERDYLVEAHPDKVPMMEEFLRSGGNREVSADVRGEGVRNPMLDWEAPQYAATLGVSCEACHLGAREHVESKGKIKPRFLPASPHLLLEDTGRPPPATGRTHDNVNWACGRCHVGGRPSFAAGMSTWNSVEYSDAMRGSCYSKLRCIDCHNPHKPIGRKWTPTADQDDAVCLECHEQFEPSEKRRAHTHHQAGSEGARCLNCHMPRINEGLQDVVRTHMIYSPTRPDMLQANHPNACNLCHTDKPIDWTLSCLKDWYGKTVDEAKIAANYPDRGKPVALGWLDSKNASVRLVAVDALTRARDWRALPQLLDALDDPFLLNRQFGAKELEERMEVRLKQSGYRFYMTEAERRKPLEEVRSQCLRELSGKGP
jgi:predicted CXXCH cytochrome family protein